MAGFIPAIHASVTSRNEDVDGRDKPGHDEKRHGEQSEAKQSRKPRSKDWIASSLALLAMTAERDVLKTNRLDPTAWRGASRLAS